jgi:hypothetical protein
LSGGAKRNAWLRTALSIAVAYAVVLQVLLGSIVATQMAIAAPDAAAALCVGEAHGAADPAGKPAPYAAHASCMVCAFASFAPPVPDAAAVIVDVAAEIVRPLVKPALGRTAHRHEPKSSRGPPQSA